MQKPGQRGNFNGIAIQVPDTGEDIYHESDIYLRERFSRKQKKFHFPCSTLDNIIHPYKIPIQFPIFGIHLGNT